MKIRKTIKKIFNYFSRPTLIIFAVISAIILAFLMNALQSFLWWGFISRDLLLIGTIDALVIAIILAPFVVSLESKFTSLEEKIVSKEIIKKSEKRLQLISENVHDVVWVLDVESMRYVYVSPSVYKQRGFTFRETLNHSLSEVLSEESLARAMKILSENMEMIRNGEEVEDVVLELQQRCKDGSLKWIEVDTHLIKNQENGKLEIVGVSRDIHERKLAEEKVRDNQIRLSRAELIAGLGNWELDLRTRQITGSPGAQIIFGLEKNTMDEMELIKLFHPDYRKKLVNDFKKIFNNKISLQGHYKIKRQNGDEIIDIYSLTQYDQEKNKIFGVIQDITDRKKIEAELKIHRDQLEKLVEERTSELNQVNIELQKEIKKGKQVEKLLNESLEKEKEINELKSRFVSTTSHEFRTPLTAMLTSAEMLKRYEEIWSREKKSEHLDKIVRSISNMVSLLDEIITFSKADSGKSKLNLEDVNLESLCEKVIEEVSVKKNANHEINAGYKDLLPSYMLDQNNIRIILNNLLVNAIKYSPDGGKVFLNVEGLDNRINICVKDEGIGIPEKDLNYLFESFFRASNTSNIQGSGLGLSIVKKSVDLHRGRISVESKEGMGTEFKVTIPV